MENARTMNAPIGTLARGLHVLSLVAANGKPIGGTELAQRANLDKATTHRLTSKLVELGYLRRDDDGKLQLGLHVLDLGFSYLASLDLRSQALPEMRRLHEEFDGSITLAVLDDTDVVYIERISPKGLQATMPVGIGARLPVHCTAMGKVILASLPPARLSAVLDRMTFKKYTERTIDNRAAFERDLALTRERGFGVTDQEMIGGLRAAAGVIVDRHGTPIAALSVALPATAVDLDALVGAIGPRARLAGEAVSARAGSAQSA
jgi:DNA-binding IclR family transcriptional regulator